MRADDSFLGQIVISLDKAVSKLEEAQKDNRIEDFNKIKGLILDLHKKMKEDFRNGN